MCVCVCVCVCARARACVCEDMTNDLETDFEKLKRSLSLSLS